MTDASAAPAPRDTPPKQSVTRLGKRHAEPMTTGSETVMQVIARIAQDPSISVERMERLIALQERILAREAEMAFVSAMSRVQPKFPTVDRKGKIVIRDKRDRDKGLPEAEQKIIQQTRYAKWEDIWEAVRDPLGEEGFTLTFERGKTPEGLILITAVLRHEKGHRETASIELQHDSTGSKNPVQAVGSTISYGKRYAAGMVLNLVSRDIEHDNDGDNGSTSAEAISPEQVTTLNALLAKSATDLKPFLDFYSERLKLDTPMTSLVELPATLYSDAERRLNQKIRQKKETP